MGKKTRMKMTRPTWENDIVRAPWHTNHHLSKIKRAESKDRAGIHRDYERLKSFYTCLVDTSDIEYEKYDYPLVERVSVLLNNIPYSLLALSCYDTVKDNLKYSEYKTSKVKSEFRLGRVENACDLITDSLIPTMYCNMDDSVIPQIKRTILAYLMCVTPEEGLKALEGKDEDSLLGKAIYITLSTEFAKFTLDFYAKQKGEEISAADVKALKGMKTNKYTTKCNEDILFFYNDCELKEGICNLYSSLYQYKKENKGKDVKDIFETIEVPEEYSFFKVLGDLNLSDDALLEYAKEKLSSDLFEKYTVLLSSLTPEYMYKTSLIKTIILENVLENLVLESRADSDEKLRQSDTNLKTALQDLRKAKKSLPKLEKEVEIQSRLLQEKDQLIAKMTEEAKDKSSISELESLKNELMKAQEALQKKDSQINKLESLNNWSKGKIKSLEEQVQTFEGISVNLVELQQENILLMQDIDRLSNMEAEDDVEYTKKLNEVKDLNFLFIGGLTGVEQKIKTVFKNARFVNIVNESENFKVPSSTDAVLVFTKNIRHAYTDRLNSIVQDKPVVYLNFCNIKLIVDKIYTQLNGHI